MIRRAPAIPARRSVTRLSALALALLGASAPALAQTAATPAFGEGLTIETGLDAILDPQTRIEGLQRLFAGIEVAPGLHLGQAIYAAALGDAGGAFFWGFEATKSLALGPGVSLKGSLFLGGGGGAAQVTGNGLMTRTGLALGFPVSDRASVDLGGAWYTLDGADLTGPALGIGLSWHPDAGGADRLKLRSMALGVEHFSLPGTLDRDGNPQGPVDLVGAEAAFLLPGGRDLLFSGAGALSGAEGYMEILGGLRQRIPLGPGTGFAEARLGFAGGGKVDTGAGLIAKAGLGYALSLTPGLDLDASLSAIAAPGGQMRGTEAGVRLVRVFDRGGEAPVQSQRWAVTLGLSQQYANAAFRKPGVPGTADPVMQESSLDLFLSDHLYLTGIADTTLQGGVAGYAMGLVGLGWTMPIAPRWDLAVEANIGAAGGGGVATAGGLVGGVRAEVDYRLSDGAAITLGLGKLQALGGDGMAPVVVQMGLKLPFSAP
jgi:hypothetical protein